MSELRIEQEAAAARERRLAAVFGDPLQGCASDDSAEAWGDERSSRGGARDDEWLRRQVPPHHG